MRSQLRIFVRAAPGDDSVTYDAQDSLAAIADGVRALGYDLTWLQSPGDHQWKYWDQMIQPALDWMCAKEGD